jgi:hypothetical protein
MVKLIIDGGAPIWFVILFGGIALAAAARFAIRGREQPLGFIKAMLGATLMATLSALCANLGAVFFYVSSPSAIASGPHRFDEMIEGFGESMSSGIMGFALLAATALLLAVGLHRSEASTG